MPFYIIEEGVKEIYARYFHTLSINSLNAAPDLVFNMLDVTNCSFAYTVMVPKCNNAHSPVQHTQHLHFLQQSTKFKVQILSCI
jgi:hypothetical protein